MVKVTMEQLIAFRDNDSFFSEASIPLKGAYKINKIKKEIEKESDFYSTKFQEIVDKYAKKDADGNLIFSDDNTQITIQEDKISECNEALTDLQQLEIEINNYNLTLDDLGEDLECTPDELEVLMPFMQ